MTNDERYAHIIKRHRPKGWRVYHSKRRNELFDMCANKPAHLPTNTTIAVAYPETRIIRAPYVVCPGTLNVLLHEFGHVHMKHWTSGANVLHRIEFEAERWAMEIMRIEGIPVSREIRKEARRYIRTCINEDLANGIEIEPHIARFAQVKIVPA